MIYVAFMAGLIVGMVIAYAVSFYWHFQIRKVWKATVEAQNETIKTWQDIAEMNEQERI